MKGDLAGSQQLSERLGGVHRELLALGYSRGTTLSRASGISIIDGRGSLVGSVFSPTLNLEATQSWLNQ